MGIILQALRLLWLVFFIFLGIGILIVCLAWINPYSDTIKSVAIWWSRTLTKGLGFNVRFEGKIKQGAYLMVGNHISWIDPVILANDKMAYYLVKAEVKNWPVVGWLPRMVGCLFIERGKGQVYQRVKDIAAAINKGVPIGVFPEATSTDGTDVVSFAPPLFKVVTEEGCPLQLFGIFYPNANGKGINTSVPFTGEQSFFANVFAFSKYWKRDAVVKYFDFEPLANETDVELAARCHKTVQAWIKSQQ